jgi:hypothetical protein
LAVVYVHEKCRVDNGNEIPVGEAREDGAADVVVRAAEDDIAVAELSGYGLTSDAADNSINAGAEADTLGGTNRDFDLGSIEITRRRLVDAREVCQRHDIVVDDGDDSNSKSDKLLKDGRTSTTDTHDCRMKVREQLLSFSPEGTDLPVERSNVSPAFSGHEHPQAASNYSQALNRLPRLP